eukprot:tig00020554_g10852.t1
MFDFLKGKSTEDKLFDQIFQLKFTAKQMIKASTKCEKEEKEERFKLKKAIEKKNMDGARIYAQNAIRKKNEAMNYLRLSSRLDAVVSKLESAMKMGQVNKSMAKVVQTMQLSMDSMDLETISKTMDQFEKQFETLDVQSSYVENAIGASTSISAPEDEVNKLIGMVAEEHGLEVEGQLPSVGRIGASVAGSEQELQARLNALRS